MQQKKFTALEKLNILQEIEGGELGLKAVAQKYGLSKTSVVGLSPNEFRTKAA
ncbi:hypothetical protein [Paenibacillus sp. UASWS1643]|uniref:hypothetical protein n=1 Tax=Paenibacillus sp. UASWS1643 TaxID=2580422 RepID=UPI001686DE93|nr:hypothetical protein [Paenibacillus sp. UASWS1643]